METKSLKIVEGKRVDLIDQTDLFKEHWDEVARNKQVMILDPDKAAYEHLESLGALFTLIAYGEDEVVGYSVNMISPHLHYKSLITCQNDIIFVKKEYRTSSPVGLRLIRATEKAAKDKGAKIMLWHAKEGSVFANLLPRIKYQVQDIAFSKVLEN